MRSSSSAVSCFTSCLPASLRSATSDCLPTATAVRRSPSAGSVSVPPPRISARLLTRTAEVRAQPILSPVQMRHPARHRTLFRCQLGSRLPAPVASLRTSTHLEKKCTYACQPILVPHGPQPALAALCCESPPHSLRKPSSRFHRFTTATRTAHLAHSGRSGAQSTASLSADSIQSPYIHRASGLLQIAVSTPLRTNSVEARRISRMRSTADTALEIYRQLRLEEHSVGGALCLFTMKPAYCRRFFSQPHLREIPLIQASNTLCFESLPCTENGYRRTCWIGVRWASSRR